MPELPLELCQAIVDEVDGHYNLLELLLVSLNFNSAVERRLYNTVSLVGLPPPSDAAQKKKWIVFERISTCSRVAAHVLHLVIELYSWPLPSPDASSCLAKVFLSVPNLKTLRIYPSHEITHNFQPRVPFLLRTFCCSGTQTGNPFFAHILEAFLEAQIELEELLFIATYTITLTPFALPKLRTVLGSGKFVRTLLPGRPITRITTLYEEEASPANPGPLRTLCLGSYTDLKWYTASFSTLTFLEYEAWDYDDVTQILPYLDRLSSLKKLRVIITDNINKEAHEQVAFVDPIFSGCPSLVCIETYDDHETPIPQNNDKSTIWTRDSQIGTPALWDVDEWRRI